MKTYTSFRNRSLCRMIYAAFLLLLLCIDVHAVDPTSPPEKFQVTVEDPDNPGNDITVNLYKRSVRRATDFKVWKWTSASGYQPEVVPPVRTYRGFVEEYPNIIICGTLFSNGDIWLDAFDSVWGRGYRWKIRWNFSSQLPAAPAGTGLANPSTTLPPDNPVTRKPAIGRAVQPVGGIQVCELAFDIQHGFAGGDLDRAVAEHEHKANVYDLTMARDCQVSIQVSQIVVRKESFYSGSVSLGKMLAEFRKEPLKSTGGDTLSSAYGHYAFQNSIGQDEGGASGGLGALMHEEGHNWNSIHSMYHYDAMEGNRPHHGPYNVDRVIEKRLESMGEGDLAPLVGNYSDPLHPYAYVDVARITKNTSVDIDVLANDWDSNGDEISVINAVANYGTVSINPDGTLHYTPSAGFEGKDIVVYTVQDDSAYQLKTRDLVHIEVVNNGLMVHYDFDETSGTIADNKTGNANLDGEIVIGDFAQNSVPSPVLPNKRGVRSVNNSSGDGRYHRANRGAITVGKEGNIIPSNLVYDRTVIPGSPWDTGTGQDNNAYNASPFDYERGEHGNYCDPMDGDYTLAFWFMHDADDFVGAYDVVRLATKYYNKEHSLGFSLWVSEDGSLSAQVRPFYQYGASYDRLDGGVEIASNASALQPRRWHHAALVIDRTGGDDVRLYLDGKLVAEDSTTLLPGQQIFMGRKPIRLGDTNGEKTCFDDLRVYAKALDGGEVAGLWQMQAADPTVESPVDLSVDLIKEETLYTYSLVPHVSYGSDGEGGVSKVSGPDWVNVSTDGTLFGYPAAADAGQSTAVIRVSDGNGDYVDMTVNLDVTFDSGMAAHWKFDEGGGTSVADSSTNGCDGTFVGTENWVAGVDGGALHLPSGSYVDIGHADITGDWSATMWVKRDGAINPGAKLLSSSAYEIQLEAAWDNDQVGIHKPGSFYHRYGYTAPVDTWVHLAFVGTAADTKLYVNGALQGAVARSIGCPMDVIGHVKGTLDDVRVYSRSLASGDVVALSVISNSAPVAVNDSAVADNDFPLPIDVLLNDSDPEGRPIGVMSVTQGANGTVVNNLNNVIYTPNPGFTGNDSFTYTVNDGIGGQDVSRVTVEVYDEAGSVLKDYWYDISGSAVSNLTSHVDYPDASTISFYQTGPIELPSSYAGGASGVRMRALLRPETTGDYQFWISADDQAELWLSTDDDPANAVKISYAPGWTSEYQWTKHSEQQSVQIPLTAGQTYYIEALAKNGGGSGHMAVAWQGPGIERGLITPNYLRTYYETAPVTDSDGMPDA